LLDDVSAKSTRHDHHMVRIPHRPLFEQFQSTTRSFATFAEEHIFFGDAAVVIEHDPVAVEGPDCKRNRCRVKVVRMNHMNRLASDDCAHFHEESCEFVAGNRNVCDFRLHFKLFGFAVEKKEKWFQTAGRIQVFELAEYPGAVAGLMRKVTVGENEVPTRAYARVRIAADLAITRSAAALPLSIESSIEKYSHRP